MNRIEFIEWLENKSGFSKTNDNCNTEWRELMNYAEYIFDELIVENDKVIFYWEEWEWGRINYRCRECSFDEFVSLYECYSLK